MKFLKVKTKYKICLTGTPQSQGYIDYYNQLYFLDKIDMSMNFFKDRYCFYEDKTFNGVKIKQLAGYKNVGEFENLYLSQCEFLKIQRVYDDIIKYHTIEIPTTKEYQRVLKDRVIYFDKDGKVVSNRTEIENYLKNEGTNGVHTKGTNENLPRALIFRDSFFYALEPFISPMFSEAEYKWKQFNESDKEYILKYKPDIIIFEAVERYAPNIVN